MLRILILLVIVAALVVLVPRLLSRSATPSAGTAAPDFALPSQEGTNVSLKDYSRQVGRLILLSQRPDPGMLARSPQFPGRSAEIC